MDPLAFAGHFTIEERDQYGLRQEHTRRQVANWNAYPHRSLTRYACHTHQAAETLRDLIDTRPFAIGAVLTETCDTRINNTRVHH